MNTNKPSLCLFGLVFLTSLSLFQAAAQATILETGAGKTYGTVAQALGAARSGDEIRIYSGFYPETNLEIKHPLTITGVGKPIIDGQNQGNLFKITAPGVVIQGLSLRNPGFSHVRDLAAIRIEATDCKVEANQIENAHFGIYLSAADKCQILDNKIHGQAQKETSSANAIHVWKSSGVLLSGNQVSGHRDGFYFEFVRNSIIKNNTSSHNLRYGLHFMFSDGNKYENNLFDSNGAGVAVMYTRNIEMRKNRFLNNWGPTAYGLLLKDISNSKIENNVFEHNTVGIHMEGSSRLSIRGNTIKNNGWAARVHANSTDNIFKKNNFSGNAFDIATNGSDSSQTDNDFNGNYWDKYTGYDLNKDGVGDVPFHPVSIFSRLVERVPPSVILLRSFLVQIMDLAEHVAPVLTPKTLADNAPEMRRIHD
jgi:nitrous oxidase accessory protein